MLYSKDFSVIIPVWRGAAKYLPKLLSTIPDKEEIEIIVVDNSVEPIGREEIKSDREFSLMHSAPNRHAGGSRNDGMSCAKGKWLLFADADDYFTPEAFNVFYSYLNSEAEIIYTKPYGIYEDTGEHSDRADFYSALVEGYCEGKVSEEDLRYGFGTPWCKMISNELVKREHLKYDEIRACNDIFFSLTSGYFAKSIEANNSTTYIVTVNHGSLTQHRDYEVIKARLYGKIHCNQFLKAHGLGHRQRSVMSFLFEARHLGIKAFFSMVWMMIKGKQNPFIGWKRWKGTAQKVREQDKANERFIVR